MTLVVGATGWLGAEICRRLRQRGVRVRGLVRLGSPKEAALTGLGVEVVHGDLKDPSSLAAACRGMAAVISTASSTVSRRPGDNLKTVDRDGQLALLEAAQRAGVTRFLYISVSPNLPENCPFLRY
jgi:NADH dehydrogenase